MMHQRAAIWFMCIALLNAWTSCCAHEDGKPQLEQRLNIRIEVLDEKVAVQLSSGKIFAEGVSGDVNDYMRRLVQEFRLYPSELIRAARLKKIVICQSLTFEGQERAAIPDFENNTLYYDFRSGEKHPRYQRAVMHHEFFHLIDFQDDGSNYKDDAWARLNPQEFSYGRGGKTVQSDSTQSSFRKPTRGFLTRYSLSGVEEDKAELFAHLIVNRLVVQTAVTTDPVLDAKVANLKALLRAFCPEMNEKFWVKVAGNRE